MLKKTLTASITHCIKEDEETIIALLPQGDKGLLEEKKKTNIAPDKRDGIDFKAIHQDNV